MPALTRLYHFGTFRLVGWSRPAGVAGVLLTVGVFLGCMSFSIDRSERGATVVPVGGGQLLDQEGAAAIPAGQAVDVFYPVPHASPPNLSLDEDFGTVFDRCCLVTQLPDRFRVRNDGMFERKVHWKSKGVSAALVPAAAVALPAQPAGPTLPTEPLPVDPKANK